MNQFLDLIKEKKILCSFVFLGILCATFGTLYLVEVTASESYTCPKLETTEEQKEETKDEEVVIDLKGAVVTPGVYHVKKGFIIQDVINLAGGLQSDADTSNLNLSKKVSNEMVITVFTKEEIKKLNLEKEPIKEKDKTDSASSNLISLNKASLEELITLPGIGEAKAKIIIEYREKCGKFESIEELKNIKGIGDALYEKLESYITI